MHVNRVHDFLSLFHSHHSVLFTKAQLFLEYVNHNKRIPGIDALAKIVHSKSQHKVRSDIFHTTTLISIEIGLFDSFLFQ